MSLYEVNFDGLIGPNHHHSGLSTDNLASMQHAFEVASPKNAALQGLKKMKLLASLGVKQAILPPHPRPNLALLQQAGFTGTTADILQKAQKMDPQLLMASYSAASMWVANAGTISPSSDTIDQKIHFTPANLLTHRHRRQEALFTAHVLKKIFTDPRYFVHHQALPTLPLFADEGAANHCRLLSVDGSKVLNMFVFGRYGTESNKLAPHKFAARQTDEASRCVANQHTLSKEATLFVQQNPIAIDHGIFHNDVIATSHRHVLFCHESAFVDQTKVYEQLQRHLGNDFLIIEVSEKEVPLELAVKSYLFNSQIVTTANDTMALIAPIECYEIRMIKSFLSRLNLDRSLPFESIHYVDCRESMHNGGGPACLRLRVNLNDEELKAVVPGVFLTDNLYEQLCQWVEKHYRNHLSLDDLVNPALVEEIRIALKELEDILQIPKLYDFNFS